LDQLIIFILVPIFFVISFVYSSVGFAGGSSYIAILTLAGITLSTVPSVALILNIIVSSPTFFNYVRSQYLSLRLSLPFMSSIPFAFISGMLVIPQGGLSIIFIVALFAASAALFTTGSKIKNRWLKKVNFSQLRIMAIAIPMGAFLGVIAGIVGIGGGIWLSPFLILTGLAHPKQAAATASLFILTNSVSGFIGHSITKIIDFYLLIPLAVVVLIGGFLGSRLGISKFDHDKIRIIVAAIVAVVGIELTFKLIF
jgi:uncharacterized protein